MVAVVEAAPLDTDAEMEPASATPAVKTDTVVMMVVEEHVEPVKEEPSVKEIMSLILANATSTAPFQFGLKSVLVTTLSPQPQLQLEVKPSTIKVRLHLHQPVDSPPTLSALPRRTIFQTLNLSTLSPLQI